MTLFIRQHSCTESVTAANLDEESGL